MKRISRLLLLFLSIFLIEIAPVYAQSHFNLNSQDLSQVNVDSLSNKQIKSLMQQAQARGLSEGEVEKLALAHGMSPAQIAKLKQRIQEIQSGGSTQKTLADSLRNLRYQSSYKEIEKARQAPFGTYAKVDTTHKIVYKSLDDSLAKNGQIFGFRLFNTKNLTFAPSLNIPTPKDYQLGPGDQLVINIWGAAQMTYQETITPEGTIQVSNLPPIYLNGLTISKAKKKIIKWLSAIYSGLSPNHPSKRNTFADVNLGKVRSINVTVVGDVRAPGTYTLPSLATVFNALYVCGGPSINGTFRDIKVIRNHQVIDSLDVYKFLTNGSTKNNIRLHDQDIIKVGPSKDRVYLNGQVIRSDLYQMKPKETLADLIHYSGGFMDNAYKKVVTVIRNTSTEKKILDVNHDQFNSFHLKDGDEIDVGKILDRFQNKVQVKGAVFRPGEYELTDTTTVYSLIKRAEGLKGDAYMPRALIYRQQKNLQTKIIPINLDNIMKHPKKDNVKLKKNDIVMVSSIFQMQANYTVRIRGAVQDTGTYPYMHNMTLNDLIMEANGFKVSATPKRVEVSRRIVGSDTTKHMTQIAKIFYFNLNKNLELKPHAKEFKLQPFDQVNVRTQPNYEVQKNVYVGGQVRYPGYYTINSKNEMVSDMIKRAGGLTKEAYAPGARLIRKTGLAGPIGINLRKILKYPHSKYDLLVMKNDSIYVPKRLETVKVRGAVQFPINVQYNQGYGFNEYISRAGGYANNALKKKAYIIYPNGSVNHIRKFLFFKRHPKVEPGSQIVVPAKPKQQGLSPQARIGIISAIVSMTATLATTVAIMARYL